MGLLLETDIGLGDIPVFKSEAKKAIQLGAGDFEDGTYQSCF